MTDSVKTELCIATILTLFQSLYSIIVLPTQFLRCCIQQYVFIFQPRCMYLHEENIVSSCVPRADSWIHALQLSGRRRK